jgi:hypothetical protein
VAVGLGGAMGTALSALVTTRVAFGASEPAGTNASAVWMAATATDQSLLDAGGLTPGQ